MTATTPIDDWADQISDAMLKPLRQVGLLLAREIEANQQLLADLSVYVGQLEQRIEALER